MNPLFKLAGHRTPTSQPSEHHDQTRPSCPLQNTGRHRGAHAAAAEDVHRSIPGDLVEVLRMLRDVDVLCKGDASSLLQFLLNADVEDGRFLALVQQKTELLYGRR